MITHLPLILAIIALLLAVVDYMGQPTLGAALIVLAVAVILGQVK